MSYPGKVYEYNLPKRGEEVIVTVREVDWQKIIDFVVKSGQIRRGRKKGGDVCKLLLGGLVLHIETRPRT